MHEGKEIVALDLDSVLCNTNSVVDKFLREKFGLHIDWNNDFVTYEFDKCPYISNEAIAALRKAIGTGELFVDAPTTNYAEYAINKLMRNNFAVYIITARPAHTQALTEDWLRARCLKYDKLYVLGPNTNKAATIEACDIKAFIEDRFDTLMKVLDRCGQLDLGLYCIDYPWTSRYRNEHIVRVEHVAEAVDRIVNYRRWKGFFLNKCVGNIDKFIKEYSDGKG